MEDPTFLYMLKLAHQLLSNQTITERTLDQTLERLKELSTEEISLLLTNFKIRRSITLKNRAIQDRIVLSLTNLMPSTINQFTSSVPMSPTNSNKFKPVDNRNECYIEQFVDNIKKMNHQKVYVSLLDEDGAFILYDSGTRDLLEQKDQAMNSRTIFQIMLPLSQKKIQQTHSHLLMSSSQDTKMDIIFSVFSESNRKKTLKYISKVKKNQSLSQSTQLEPSGLRSSQRNKRSPTISIEDEIYCKYLKCLSMNMCKTQVSLNKFLKNLYINREALESLVSSKVINLNENNPILSKIINGEVEQVSFQAVLCQLREAQEFEQFDIKDLQENKQIQEYEKKVMRKILKKNIKMVNQQEL